MGATNPRRRATSRKESPSAGTARPRRRTPLRQEPPEQAPAAQAAPPAEPAQHPAESFPESAGPAAAVSGYQLVSGSEDHSPAPAPAQPEPRRICAFCGTPQPLSALAQVATWLECADRAACAQRARQSDLYARSEDELAIAHHKIAAGAPG